MHPSLSLLIPGSKRASFIISRIILLQKNIADINLEGKTYQNDSDLHEIFVNQTFPLFPLRGIGLRKRGKV